jgi:2'-5' RNA ligase
VPSAERDIVSVDVVLLLPGALAARARRLSARLDPRLRLGPHAAPHITLAMATVRRDTLPALWHWLADAGRRTPALELTVTRIAAVPGPRRVSLWYEIARTPALDALHGEAVRVLEGQRQGEPGRKTLVLRPGERVSASTLRWIAEFGREAAFARYRPHVTLGYVPRAHARLPEEPHGRLFRAARLALFQLGNHCTCARRLAAVRLRGPAAGLTRPRTG